jgi:hypothetical protein
MSNPNWYGPAALKGMDFSKHPVVEAASDIFGPDNIRQAVACASAAVCIVVREFIFCSANSSVVPVKY